MAFGNEDNEQEKLDNKVASDENNSILRNQIINKNIGNQNSDKFYEQALFTINNVTVEITLENETLSWATVTGEGMLL